MTNQQILAALAKAEIKTIGDLDRYASVRQMSRWHALAQLVGAEAADRVFGLLAVRIAKREAIQ